MGLRQCYGAPPQGRAGRLSPRSLSACRPAWPLAPCTRPTHFGRLLRPVRFLEGCSIRVSLTFHILPIGPEDGTPFSLSLCCNAAPHSAPDGLGHAGRICQRPSPCPGLADQGGGGAGRVWPVRRPRRRGTRRVCAGHQATGQQAGRPARRICADRHGGQPRPGQAAGRPLCAARKDRPVHRPHRQQRGPGRSAHAVCRQGALPVEQRRPQPAGRCAVQPLLFRHGLPERPVSRSRRPVCGRPEIWPHGADRPQLPRGQGFAHRLQAQVQGPGGRRDLHQGGADRLRDRAGPAARRQARCRVFLPARRHGHQLHQAVRRGGSVQGHHPGHQRFLVG